MFDGQSGLTYTLWIALIFTIEKNIFFNDFCSISKYISYIFDTKYLISFPFEYLNAINFLLKETMVIKVVPLFCILNISFCFKSVKSIITDLIFKV